MNKFHETYFTNLKDTFNEFLGNSRNIECLNEAVKILENTRISNKTIYIIGNGGSSSIAEHIAIELTKNAGLRAMAFSGSPLLTTFSNDFGYDRVFQKAIEHFANEKDVLIAISGTGTSKNILNACLAAKKKNMEIITLSGFGINNPLRKVGDINFWVDSKAFGYIEMIHTIILHYCIDAIIGSAEYMIR